MAYSDELEKEVVESQYLAVITPRRNLNNASWGTPSAGQISQSFTLGQIVRIDFDGVVATEASSRANIGVDGVWFYDVDEQILYAQNTYSSDFAVAFYEIYLGTFDAYWYRDPADNLTRVVYYEPLIISSPEIQQNTTDDLFGFLPSFSSAITISNATLLLVEHLYESSFNLAEIKIFHYLNELTDTNIKLVFNGFCKNINYTDSATRIELFDNTVLFEKEFRHPSGKSFYGSSFLSGLDPDFDGRPIRRVFGRIDSLVPVNIDFEADAPSTTNNRTHIVMNPNDDLVSLVVDVVSSPVSTTTRTYVDDVTGFTAGDMIWIDKTTDEYVFLTAVVTTSAPAGYFDHAALVSGAATSGDTVKRGFIGNVYIYRQNFAPLGLKYIQDYTIYTDATNKLSGFDLADNFEANYNGAGQMFENTGTNPTSLTTSDLIYCRAYGPVANSADSIGGSQLGSTSFTYDNSINITYSILKRFLGLPESQIDTAAFQSLFAAARGSATLGFAIPDQRLADYPSFKELLSEIFQSVLIKFFINDDNQYSITVTRPLASVSKTIEDDEILSGQFTYDFDYKDIVSDIFVNYNRREISAKYAETITYDTVSSATSEAASYLHQVSKQKTINTVLSNQNEAQDLADRLSFALGDRRGRIEFSTKNRFFDTQINQNIQISRDRMPGFSYVSETLRDREGAVISSNKNLTRVGIVIDDQKGIESKGTW